MGIHSNPARAPAARRALRAGASDCTPLILGVFPFALISGILAVESGLDLVQTMGMAVFVFAGASQLAALQLLQAGAVWPVIVLTALVINLRFVMYSASLAPHFSRLNLPWKAGLAYLLTDQAYALSITRFQRPDRLPGRRWYYLGVALVMWCTWQTGTACGALLGTQIPAGWSLDFAIPLTFLALLVPNLNSRPQRGAALAAGGCALGAAGLPLNLGLMLGAAVGIACGLWLEARAR